MALDRLASFLRRIPVTLALTAAVSLVFALEHALGGPGMAVLQRMGAMNADRLVEHGELWRLITAIFLHANLLHYGLNTVGLVQLCLLVEVFYGSERLLLFFLVCGLVGNLCMALFTPSWLVGSVGASGALFGLVGLCLGLASYGPERWRLRLHRLQRPLRITVGIAVAMAVAEWLLGTRVIGHWAHLGGFLTGLLLAAAHPDPDVPPGGVERLLAAGAGGAMVGAGLAAALWGGAALQTLPAQWVEASLAQVEAAPGPFGQSLAAVRGIEVYRELDLPDREARTRELVARLSPEALMYAASSVYAMEDRDEEARWIGERWVELAPERSAAWNYLAWQILTRPGPGGEDPARALELVEQALARLPEDATFDDAGRRAARAAYLDTRAEALFQLGRLDEALEDQREAVDLGEAEGVSELPAMRDRLGRIERALGT